MREFSKIEKGTINIKIVIAIILVITIIGFVLFFLLNKKDKIEVLEKIPYEYFLLSSEAEENDKVGVIDKKGKEIIKKEYDDIYIPNPSKDVFICSKDGENKILNSSGKEIFKEFDGIAPIMLSLIHI